MNKPKRNHHVLPKLYLKGFAIRNDPPHIWIYKRGDSYNPGEGIMTNNPYRRSIDLAGAEWDFFADPLKDGKTDFETFENVLETLEKPANAIFGKLRSFQTITPEEKSAFSRYVILMQTRVWAGREQVKQLLPKTFADSKPPNDLHMPDLHTKWKAALETLRNREDYHVNLHNRITAFAPHSFRVQALQKMTWTFYVAQNSNIFFTGDNPVFVPKSIGLGKSNSELSFPLSTHIALNASWDRTRKEGFEDAKPEIVKEINRRTIGQSSKIYCSQDQDWIVTMLKKGEYKWHPIYTPKSIYTVAELVQDTPEAKPYLKIHAQ